MKINLFIFLLPLFLLMQQELNAQGIRFEDTSWETILQKASDEGKIIFMDAYAEWCGPCKAMSKNVFTDGSVGAFFNDHFINVKMDMEHGEGVALAEKYEVRAYPTLLFIDGKGELVHRAVGYHASDDFIELGNIANDENQNMGGLNRRWEKGDRTPEFLYQYAMTKADAMDPSYGEVVDAYMATQSDWTTEQNMEFIFRFAEDIDSPLFAYLLKNRADFEDQFGKEQVTGHVMNSVSSLLYEEENEEENLARASQLFQEFDPENAEEMNMQFQMYFYLVRGMTDDYARIAVDLYTKFPPEGWQALNEAAWSFYESVDNETYLKTALGWAQKSVELNKNYYNTDTVAALYYKLGEKKNAIKAAKEAIKVAKASGEDPSGTQELLKNIKAM